MASTYTITSPRTGSTGKDSTSSQTYPGGVGYNMTLTVVYNDSSVTGGQGGVGRYLYGATTDGGLGGVGIVLSSGTLDNYVLARGGAGGNATGQAGDGGYGVQISGSGSVVNVGDIYGGAGGNGLIGGFLPGTGGNGGAGVDLSGGILTNYGVIGGGAGGSGVDGSASGTDGAAVVFGPDAATLIDEPNAVFEGTVIANSSVDDTLQLDGDRTSGTGVTLGTEFTGFSKLDFGPNAYWNIEATVNALNTHAPTQSDFDIEGFTVHDSIDITNLKSGSTLNFDPTTEVLTITEPGGPLINLQFASQYSGEHFVLSGNTLELQAGACFRRGTRIRCEHGEAAIESLKIGDRVMTASGIRPIRWIGRRRHSAAAAFANKDILPIRIRAGALDANVPERDLWVSPEHAMYIDGLLIPAIALVNGTSIVQEQVAEELTYLHLEFDSHTIIYSEGAPTESFVDDQSRQMFDNADEYAVLYPDAPVAIGEAARFCAPRVEDGEDLERVRLRLSRRAQQILFNTEIPSGCVGSASPSMNFARNRQSTMSLASRRSA